MSSVESAHHDAGLVLTPVNAAVVDVAAGVHNNADALSVTAIADSNASANFALPVTGEVKVMVIW